MAVDGGDVSHRDLDQSSGWNETATSYERDSTIHEVFGQRVAEHADAVAIVQGRRAVSYRELDGLATALARRLEPLIDGDDQCVGVVADRSIDAVVAFLGVLKAGAAFVPLEPDLPAERLRYIVADTGARAVLAQDQYLDLATRLSDVAVLPIDAGSGDRLPADRGPGRRRPPRVGPRSLAYVMYTSGSTGRPKGVEIEHRGVLRYVRGATGLIPERGDHVLHVGLIGFDVSTYEIWGALCNGARLVVHARRRFDPVEVGRTIKEHAVTIGMFSAGALHLMVDGALDSLGGFRLLISTSDVLSPGHARRLRDAHPATRLVNAYGPTETTITASVYDVDRVETGQSIPIGRPLANTELYVLDERLEPVGAGDVGELCAGGEGIARGYRGLPEVTAQRFVPDPFGSVSDGRLYRTGDLVRMLPSGDLEFLGRLDDQVKIRGFRVEPAEVAAVLSGHDAVESAQVVVRDGGAGAKQLVAVVTSNYEIDAPRLRRYLRHRLPDYMVPAQVVILDEMPQTPIGKLDRSALAALVERVDRTFPATSTERAVARAWSEVIGIDDVMVEDDFFESGGDSLTALHMLAQLRTDLGVYLPLSSVFDERTVGGLARFIDLQRAEPTHETATLGPWPVLVTGEESGVAQASVAQSQVCFLGELADEALPYQSNAVIEFAGALDVAALERAVQDVVDRHQILRTTFAKVGGSWMQQIHPTFAVSLSQFDLRGEPDPEAALNGVLDVQLRERIDPAQLPLVLWTLVRQADDRSTLIQVEHHLIHDGWSFATLVGEIMGAYRARATGAPVPFAPLDYQYADFARWQNSFADTPEGRRQLAFWMRTLSGAPAPPVIGTDHLVPLERTFAGASLRYELPSELVDRIYRAASRSGGTPYMVMLAAFVVLLSRLSGEHDVVVGSGLANRRVEGTEQLLGMLVNTVAIRVALGEEATVDQVLDAVKVACLGAFEHQEIPFEEVVRALGPVRRAGSNPVYEHLFSFHDSLMPEPLFDNLEVRVRDALGNGSAKADLNVIVINQRGRGASVDEPDGKELTIVWEFATDIFDRPMGGRLLATYLHLLEQMVTHRDEKVVDLELTTGPDRDLLVAAGTNEAPYERDATVDGVFADRVREAPDAVAAVAGTTSLTYRELHLASMRLAQRLASLGVGPGSRVGVSDDRSLSTIVSLLSIVRTGAAYVGIDRSLPPARLGQVISSAEIRVVCASPGASARFAELGVIVVDVEVDERTVDESRWIEEAGDPIGWRHEATDAVYVSFTSGSTGEPKGVEVIHRGVVRLVRGTDYVTLGPTEVLLAGAPLAFDASTFEVWGALLNGGRVVLAPPGPLSTAEIAEALVENGVTTAFFTAGLFHQLVDHELEALSTLRQVLGGGDVLSPAHVNRLLQAIGPEAVVVNGYGPTEGTTFTCCHVMRRGSRVSGPVPLGQPIANTSVVIVDDRGDLVPDGVAGELWIGGDGVARGYVGRPDLTEDRFVSNPFAGRLGDRLYRTGDLVRRTSDGTLQFLGRIDRQVKIRGFRVEPAEVELRFWSTRRWRKRWYAPSSMDVTTSVWPPTSCQPLPH